jgi:mannosyl-oligosaccharide glucosidase
LDKASTSYNALFESRFKLAEKKFSKDKIAFAQLLTSNMLGGIGYFHGEAIVDRGLEGYEEDEPTDFADDDEVK